jgi:hypothetical protein
MKFFALLKILLRHEKNVEKFPKLRTNMNLTLHRLDCFSFLVEARLKKINCLHVLYSLYINKKEEEKEAYNDK